MLLVGLAVAACSNSAAEPFEVTGTEVCSQIASGVLSASYECEDQTSDLRVSGVLTGHVVLEQATAPTVMSGTVELVNDGGTRVGDWTGEVTPSNNHIMNAILVGTGEYEGLEYDVRWEGVGYPYSITGTIRASG